MQVKRICEQCGKEFYRHASHIKQNGGKFCTRTCWIKSHTAKLNRICETCGKEFHAKENEIARGKGKYCSRPCSDIGRRSDRERKCLYCGNAFHKNPANPTEYCSAKCYQSDHRIDLVCRTCGKEFSRSVAYATATGGKYCSKHCAGKARAVEHKYICEVCGKEFLGEAKGRKFCSTKCRKVGQSGPGNPHWMGGKSFEPYCYKWTEALRESIREEFGRKCYLCPTTEKENGVKLSVHHINFDKMAGCYGKRWNLVPLCKKHHTKSSFNRFKYFNLLSNYWAMNKNINFGGGGPDIYAFCLGGT